jgi:hypothetical protein
MYRVIFFRGLELAPAAGRLLNPGDDRTGAGAVAVLSCGFSESHFGSAGAAVGREIIVNNIPFTVLGVARPGFDGVDPLSVALTEWCFEISGCDTIAQVPKRDRPVVEMGFYVPSAPHLYRRTPHSYSQSE